jgi:CDP-2,3-bis-(O-geranylgeranyl)-sn-glycerol synthase
MSSLLFALWFFLPAGLANASPVFASRIGFLQPLYKPIDVRRNFRGKRILGDNKTFLGVIFSILVGLAVIGLQKYGYNHSEGLRTISGSVNYSQPIIWWLGPLLGFGAIFGDALKSFFKRQIGIKSGRSWFPFDQIDYILGGLLFSLVVVRLSVFDYLLIILIWLVLHLITSYLGYLFKLKARPI